MRRRRSLPRLPPHELGLLLQAGSLVLVTRVALWCVPFRTLCWLIRRLPRPPARSSAESPPTASQVGQAVAGVSRYIPAASCLTQALAAHLLLTWRGLPNQLTIGVRHGAQGQFAAHAWVECQGQVVVGGPHTGRYARLLTL